MIKLGDFLGNILSQIGEARMQADQASIDMARQYATDDFLRTMPIPRMRLPQIELTIPVCIEEVQQKDVTELNVSTFLAKTLDNSFVEYNNLKKNGLTDRKEWTMDDRKSLEKNIKTMLSKRAYKLETENDRKELLKELTTEIRTSIGMKIEKVKLRSRKPVKDELSDRLQEELNKSLIVKPKRLSDISYVIKSNDMKELIVDKQQSIMLKLSVKEEGFELVLKETAGQESEKPIDKADINNYYISIE